MPRSNYKVEYDGIFFDITRTDEVADGLDVFDTFAAAQKEVVSHMMNRAEDFLRSARDARKLKASQVF